MCVLFYKKPRRLLNVHAQVMQKLFQYCKAPQKGRLVATMKGEILSLSLHQYGSRVVQKVKDPPLYCCIALNDVAQAIESIEYDQQVMFVRELKSNILLCVKNSHGSHVSLLYSDQRAPRRL